MDEEEMSHTSNWSGSHHSGPSAFQMGVTRSSGMYRNYGSGQSVSSDGDISLKRDREREGRCSECGVQTHEFRMDSHGQPRKIPLTVENEVHRGRCLLCHPLSQSHLHTMDNVFRSIRSLNTVSTTGSYSNSNSNSRPDFVGSNASTAERSNASTVSNSNTAVDDALAHFENESCDLLDILTAMRRFPRERRVQERGCEKLWIQSWDDENSSAIGRVGGIPTLLGAMSSFPMSQRLQQSGCEALQNLALNDFNNSVIVENGGINIIVQAMNNHPDVVGVQQCGCTALANLAASPDNHLDIANAGGLHAIMNAAQRNQEEESVLRAAYQALRAMGYDPNRHGPAGQQQQPQQQQQQQQQPQQQQQSQGVVRLDRHGFPIN
eukprot:CAMPEP_0116555690 /NCGR_PEP_ID=MMETSP0397-20121206/8285_1 /TAXON_ID=216820 /ORGANISM="Cyclophora tenuis, Strain ECT3854" /LENGTH=378 /DNA_ID=CAMNT_0004080985 /DNA_START=315 /DNA_END=1451 /DNA_ORIENTATION=+